MWRQAIGLLLSVGPVLALAQEIKHFRVAPDTVYQTVRVDYSTSSGTCYLTRGSSSDPLAVYSTRDIDDFNHSFRQNRQGRTLEVSLALEEKSAMSFSQSISSRMFTKSRPEDNVWRMVLSEEVPYDLNLSYGIGEAYIDLSGLQVVRLQVRTGSANVNIGYLEDRPNAVPMQEMLIAVDVGDVQVRQLHRARVRQVSAEVGFGDMLLDMAGFAGQPCRVDASVGAGSLEVLIPRDGTPVIIHIKKSMLCDVRLSRSFAEAGENTFTNTAYDPQAPDLLEFRVDVSFGSIVFKEKR